MVLKKTLLKYRLPHIDYVNTCWNLTIHICRAGPACIVWSILYVYLARRLRNHQTPPWQIRQCNM